MRSPKGKNNLRKGAGIKLKKRRKRFTVHNYIGRVRVPFFSLVTTSLLAILVSQRDFLRQRELRERSLTVSFTVFFLFAILFCFSWHSLPILAGIQAASAAHHAAMCVKRGTIGKFLCYRSTGVVLFRFIAATLVCPSYSRLTTLPTTKKESVV